MSKHTSHVCVLREIEEAEREIQRDLPADDVKDFDTAIRILLVKEFVEQVIVQLPEFVIEPLPLHHKFLAWVRARTALDRADVDLHGKAAFDELIGSKRQLQRYIGYLRNRAHNAVEIAHELRRLNRLDLILVQLGQDVRTYPESYAKVESLLPYLILSTFEYSRYLKHVLPVKE